MTDLLVVGAGPTGLTAAAEAVRHGLTVRIIDANAQRSIHSKALVLHSRTLELFTDMGFVERVLENGQEFRALHRRYGAGEEALYLIRPDQHIGYRSQPVIATKFAAYLAEIFAIFF